MIADVLLVLTLWLATSVAAGIAVGKLIKAGHGPAISTVTRDLQSPHVV